MALPTSFWSTQMFPAGRGAFHQNLNFIHMTIGDVTNAWPSCSAFIRCMPGSFGWLINTGYRFQALCATRFCFDIDVWRWWQQLVAKFDFDKTMEKKKTEGEEEGMGVYLSIPNSFWLYNNLLRKSNSSLANYHFSGKSQEFGLKVKIPKT